MFKNELYDLCDVCNEYVYLEDLTQMGGKFYCRNCLEQELDIYNEEEDGE